MYSHSHPKNGVVTKYPMVELPVFCWWCRLTDGILNICLMCLHVNKKYGQIQEVLAEEVILELLS
jgi:hypothetical protein